MGQILQSEISPTSFTHDVLPQDFEEARTESIQAVAGLLHNEHIVYLSISKTMPKPTEAIPAQYYSKESILNFLKERDFYINGVTALTNPHTTSKEIERVIGISLVDCLQIKNVAIHSLYIFY